MLLLPFHRSYAGGHMPDCRETIIRLDHGEGYAEIWTQEANVLKKLDHGNCRESDQQHGGVWRRVPLDRFRWKILGPRGRLQRTEAQIAAALKLHEARHAK
jgi:hypothetical protein